MRKAPPPVYLLDGNVLVEPAIIHVADAFDAMTSDRQRRLVADFLAKHDLKGMVTLNGERITDQVFHTYRDACARHGREKRLGQDLCLGGSAGVNDVETQMAIGKGVFVHPLAGQTPIGGKMNQQWTL